MPYYSIVLLCMVDSICLSSHWSQGQLVLSVLHLLLNRTLGGVWFSYGFVHGQPSGYATRSFTSQREEIFKTCSPVNATASPTGISRPSSTVIFLAVLPA